MNVPKTILTKLVKIAAPDGSAHAMNGIHFARKGKRCSAEVTDGSMLVRVEWNSDSKKKKNFETTLSAESIKRAQNGIDQHVELRETDGAILDNLDTQDIQKVDGKFRDTGAVIPDYEADKCHVLWVDPKRLATLLDVISSVVPVTSPPCVEIVCPLDTKRPLRISVRTKDAGVSVLAVLMPMREPEYPTEGLE